MIEQAQYSLYFDGSVRGTPLMGGCGWVIKKNVDNSIFKRGSKNVPNNNGTLSKEFAAYSGLVEGLKLCRWLKLKELIVRSDCQTVIDHINGKTVCSEESLQLLLHKVRSFKGQYESIQFELVSTLENTEAAKLADKRARSKNVEQNNRENNPNHPLSETANVARNENPRSRRRSLPGRASQNKENIVPDPVQEDVRGNETRNNNVNRRSNNNKGRGERRTNERRQIPNPFKGVTHAEDFSEEWLTALEAINVYENDVEYHILLQDNLRVLAGIDALAPPSVRPPPRPESSVRKASYYAFMRSRPQIRRSMPVRYLLFMAQCGHAESINLTVESHLRKADHEVVCDLLVNAVAVLNMSMSEHSYWSAIWLDAKENDKRGMLQDGHEYKELCKLVECVQLVRETIEKRKGTAIHKLEKVRQKLANYLDTLLQDRNEVKRRMGERWKNNPNPKMTHAEKIAQTQRALRELEDIIATIESLVLLKLFVDQGDESDSGEDNNDEDNNDDDDGDEDDSDNNEGDTVDEYSSAYVEHINLN